MVQATYISGSKKGTVVSKDELETITGVIVWKVRQYLHLFEFFLELQWFVGKCCTNFCGFLIICIVESNFIQKGWNI